MVRSSSFSLTDAQLQALVAVADHGSFTHAARQLQVSQSAVSHAVTALEESLGVDLLIRNASGVRLTSVGERMVQRAREVLKLKALMRHEAEATRGLRDGTVRVGSFGMTASQRLLPPILRHFAQGYPDITVRVIEGTDQEVEQWLREGKVDLGFVTLPNDDFHTMVLAQDEMTAVLAADHRLAGSDRIQPHQLGAYPFIMSMGGCEPAIREILDESGVNVRYHIREVHTIVEMVRQGAGVSIKPTLSLPDPMPAGVVVRPLDPPRPRTVGLAAKNRRDLSPAGKAFLKVAGSHRRRS